MSKTKTPTFLLELPLQVDDQQAKHVRAHFEAARCLYNTLLGEAMKRLKHLRADPRWQEARRIPKVHKQERQALFSQLRQKYGFSEFALHAYCQGYRYYAQLALEGVAYQKPKHQAGTATVGLDLGPSTLAMVPEEGEARLLSFCQELKTDQQKKRRLQRRLDRQRRANNPQNYDQKGRVKKGKKQRFSLGSLSDG
jgi:hypothetical protein